MVTIRITDLHIRAHHGLLPQERTVGNDFTVSVTLHLPDSAGLNDSIHETVDYAEVVKVARQVMAIPSMLLEHVTARLVDALQTAFPIVTGGSVTVCKLSPPITGFDASGVSITRDW